MQNRKQNGTKESFWTDPLVAAWAIFLLTAVVFIVFGFYSHGVMGY